MHLTYISLTEKCYIGIFSVKIKFAQKGYTVILIKVNEKQSMNHVIMRFLKWQMLGWRSTL